MDIELPKIVNDANVGEWEHEVPMWMCDRGSLVIVANSAEIVSLYPEQVQALVNELAKLGIVAEVQA